MEVSLQTGLLKLSFWASWHIKKIFKGSKYKRKIEFDKVWEYQNGEFRWNGATKIQIFLLAHARQIIFLGFEMWRKCKI